MPVIDLDRAVDQIRQACQISQSNQRRAFFFIAGAGISYPEVPLAFQIADYCRAIAKGYNRTAEPPSQEPMVVYSHWFSSAFPNPIQRQEYLRNLIEAKPMSHANLRLAHLLLTNAVTNLVVTPNFDHFLSRALTLFGKPHVVCDHPQTLGRIDPNRDDVQIVHVHGTYWFYDCCNLKDEIGERAGGSRVTNSTTAAFLDRLLLHQSPIVIGYSGWDGDVIMGALRRRLQGRLPYNIYWFCYRRSVYHSFPNWLTKHPNVSFVLPAESEGGFGITSAPSEKQRDERNGSKAYDYRGGELPEREEATDPALPAQRVLERLIQSFSLEAPELTRDPLAFFARQLHDSLPKDRAAGDLYLIESVVERIQRARRAEMEHSAAAAIEAQFEQVRDALRRSQYRQSIKYAEAIQRTDLSPAQLQSLMEAVYSAALRLANNSEEELAGYVLAIDIADMLLRKDQGNLGLRELVGRALVNKASVLRILNRADEEIAVYDEIVRRFGEAGEQILVKFVAWALMSKAYRLSLWNRNEE